MESRSLLVSVRFILFATLWLLCACTREDVPPSPSKTPISPVQLASYVGRFGEGDAAGIEGRVAVKSGCIVLKMSGSALILPVFPEEGISSAAGVPVFGGISLREGDLVSLSGGYRDNANLKHWATIPPACDSVYGDLRIFQVSR